MDCRKEWLPIYYPALFLRKRKGKVIDTFILFLILLPYFLTFRTYLLVKFSSALRPRQGGRHALDVLHKRLFVCCTFSIVGEDAHFPLALNEQNEEKKKTKSIGFSLEYPHIWICP